MVEPALRAGTTTGYGFYLLNPCYTTTQKGICEKRKTPNLLDEAALKHGFIKQIGGFITP